MTIPLQSDEYDEKVLNQMIAVAEGAYDEMFESSRPSGCYSIAKECYYDAIAYAGKFGKDDVAKRLTKRLEHIKSVFRHQFS